MANEIDTSKFENTEAFEQGLAVRTAVLGEAYVSRSIEQGGEDPFLRKLQQFATEYAWGTVWCSDGLDRRTHSLINIALLAGLGREAELKLHTRGAINNGVTPDEIAEALLQCGVYAGVPAAVSGFRAAKEMLDEMGVG